MDVAHNVLGFEVLKNWLVEKSIDDPILIMALGIKKDYKNILKQIKRIKPGLLVFLRKTKLDELIWIAQQKGKKDVKSSEKG